MLQALNLWNCSQTFQYNISVPYQYSRCLSKRSMSHFETTTKYHLVIQTFILWGRLHQWLDTNLPWGNSCFTYRHIWPWSLWYWVLTLPCLFCHKHWGTQQLQTSQLRSSHLWCPWSDGIKMHQNFSSEFLQSIF